MTIYRLAAAAVALTVAAVLQMTLSFSLAIGPARPDFVLTTLACTAVLMNYPSGAAAGIWGGILMSALVGVNYGSFLASRAITGAFCGWVNQRFFRDDAIVPPLVTFVATFLCEAVYYLMAPTHRALWWFERVAWEALYNTLLSLPITLALRWAGVKRQNLSPFQKPY